MLKYECCDALRLIFGNFSLRIPGDHLESFKACVESFDTENIVPKEGEMGRPFSIHLHEGLSLSFSAGEVIELRELLDWSFAAISVDDLLKDSESGK